MNTVWLIERTNTSVLGLPTFYIAVIPTWLYTFNPWEAMEFATAADAEKEIQRLGLGYMWQAVAHSFEEEFTKPLPQPEIEDDL